MNYFSFLFSLSESTFALPNWLLLGHFLHNFFFIDQEAKEQENTRLLFPANKHIHP